MGGLKRRTTLVTGASRGITRLIRGRCRWVGCYAPCTATSACRCRVWRGVVSERGHRALVARAVPELSDRQYALLTQDHWYRSDRLWARTGEDPGPGFATRFAEVADWYTDHLAGRVGRVPGTR